MRTTLTIHDEIAALLKKRAFETGKSFKEVVNEALRAGLDLEYGLSKAKPYHLTPAKLGEVRHDMDLNKALPLADALENDEIAGKLRQRK